MEDSPITSDMTMAVISDDAVMPKARMSFFDVVRGFSVISMVLFHLCYDLRFIYDASLDFFTPPFIDIWRASISWTFLFVAGCMCVFSRNNLRRSLRYLAVAAAIYAMTSIVAVDAPINFGIIFCMGGSTLVYHVLDRLGVAPRGRAAAIILFAAFLLLLNVPMGHIGFGPFALPLPRQLYAHDILAFAGFHGPRFVSGDYYPLIPFTLMYLSGAAMGNAWKRDGFPAWMASVQAPALETAGRLALPIYLLHQPIILGVLQLFS